MNSDDWIEKLRNEGYSDVRVCPVPSTASLPSHLHDAYTVHIILTGAVSITNCKGKTDIYFPGERVEFPPGTVQTVKGATRDGTMIVGVRQ